MGAYSYKQNAQEIFENFFGTKNPFATFGFEAMPFASKLNKPGPVKGKPVVFNLECSLKGIILCVIPTALYVVKPSVLFLQSCTTAVPRNSTSPERGTIPMVSWWMTRSVL